MEYNITYFCDIHGKNSNICIKDRYKINEYGDVQSLYLMLESYKCDNRSFRASLIVIFRYNENKYFLSLRLSEKRIKQLGNSKRKRKVYFAKKKEKMDKRKAKFGNKLIPMKDGVCGRCRERTVFRDEKIYRCCGCGLAVSLEDQIRDLSFRSNYKNQQILTCPKGYHKHHITDKIVIPIPAKIHMECGAGWDVEKHREYVLDYLAARNPVLYGIAIFLLEENDHS